jgi:hypothetical protein
MHPVGPLNPKVYWVRRVAIVVLAVAVLIGLVWFLANRSSGSSAGTSAASASADAPAAPTLTGVLAASSGATRSSTASASPSPTSGSPVSGSPLVTDSAAAPTDSAASPPAASPSEVSPPADPAVPPADTAPAPPAEPTPAPPPPSYDADGTLLCADSAIALTAITSAPSFPSGGQPTLGMTVTNTGAEACRRDVSGTLQTFTVQGADGSRKWSTTDCFPGEGSEIRDLAPRQELRYTIKWSGTTSEPGCAGERAPVPPGDYVVIAQLGGLSSAPAPFVITG